MLLSSEQNPFERISQDLLFEFVLGRHKVDLDGFCSLKVGRIKDSMCCSALRRAAASSVRRFSELILSLSMVLTGIGSEIYQVLTCCYAVALRDDQKKCIAESTMTQKNDSDFQCQLKSGGWNVSVTNLALLSSIESY
jgi:hypothetical protein